MTETTTAHSLHTAPTSHPADDAPTATEHDAVTEADAVAADDAQADAWEPGEPPADLVAGEPEIVALNADQRACMFCGVALTRPARVVTHHAILNTQGRPSGAARAPGRVPLEFGVCDTCHDSQTRAEELVNAHGVLAATWGKRNAVERLTSALTAVEAVGRELLPLDARSAYSLGLMLGVTGRAVAFSVRYGAVDTIRASVDKAPAKRWGHTTGRERLEVVVSYLVWRRMEAVRDAPPVKIAPPRNAQGCMLCGVDHVAAPAPAVVRQGERAVAREVWTPRTATVASLTGTANGSGTGRTVSGYLCLHCKHVADDLGTLGVSAVEIAFADHLHATGTARSVAALEDLRGGYTGGALAWALSGAPAGQPWAHLAEHPAVAR